MQSYLTERKQRTKINQAYSSWKEILFSILLSNLFLVVRNIGFASYVDDNTILT